MDEDRILERERFQMEQIRELDDEELQVEEVEGLPDDSSDEEDANVRALGTNGTVDEFTFNACLASLHTYMGGVVLFPEATLPLRIIQPNFVVAVERAMGQVDFPYTIGVVRVYRDTEDGRLRFATVGTTAEIRQYRRLEDGSVNVVTHGKQRFNVRRQWIDVDGAPCAEVEIIEEDLPLRTPRDAFGTLPPLLSNLSSRSLSRSPNSCKHGKRDEIASNCC